MNDFMVIETSQVFVTRQSDFSSRNKFFHHMSVHPRPFANGQKESAKTELVREVVGASGLTAELADILIDRVYVYPGSQVEIIWKIKGFYGDGT